MKKEKKKGSWLSVFIIIMVAAAVASEDSEVLKVSIILAIVVAVVGFMVFAVAGAAKKGSGNIDTFSGTKNKNVHSHDRLTVSSSELMECNGLDHYKKQLDGFLSAGIIDRSEYNVLLQKYRSQLGK